MRSRRTRLLYLAFGWGCFGLGIIGALLPLLPTTPFMLVALWAFSPIKLTAYVSMLGSLNYTAFIGDFHWAIPVATAVLILVGIYFISRCPSRAPRG